MGKITVSRKSLLGLMAGLLCAALLVVAPLKAAENPKKLRLAYAGWGLETAIAWVGIEAGLFKKYELNVEEVIIRDGPSGGVHALLGVDVFLGFGNPVNLVQAILGGGDIVFLGSHVSIDQYGFGVSPDISTIPDLKGKKIGVSALGGRSDLAARVILRRAGLDPTRDVEMVFVGLSPQRMIALSQKLIQGTPLAPDVAAEAKRRGIRVIEAKDVPVVTALLMTTRSFVKRDEESVRRFMKGYVASIHYYLTHRNESIGIMKKYLSLSDPRAFESMYEAFAAQLGPFPAPSGEATQAIIDVAGVADQKATSLKPKALFDLRFLEELKASGFIDDLYSEKKSL
ncbi:MAG: ABC transporter substrate-binding protein [Deltaproteobacteria bacterium]|nr:ABC transporter substrate-binding protein [Deltaproteobacteria bacterium]